MARPRQISDEQIDLVARQTFVQHGSGVAVSTVARKLGVSHSALLLRAGSKEKLLLRALRPSIPEVAARLRSPPPKEGEGAALAQLLFELLLFHEAMLPGLMVLRSSGHPTRPPGAGEPPTLMLRRLLTRWLVRTAKLEKARCGVLADALLGALEARCFNAHLGGEHFVSGTHQRFVRALIHGLTPQLNSQVSSRSRVGRKSKR